MAVLYVSLRLKSRVSNAYHMLYDMRPQLCWKHLGLAYRKGCIRSDPKARSGGIYARSFPK